MDGFQRGVAAQGFAVRRLPSPLYLRCHVGALVSSADGRDRLDPTLREVPVLGLAVAPQWTDVLRDLAEDAASLRYLRHGSPALSTGAGPETGAVCCDRLVPRISSISGRVQGWW